MIRFFIGRPIFATVIAILFLLAGAFAGFQLPISQFPLVTPPTIQVDCNYPGADSDVVAKTVAAPIEQRVNGVERMLYMSSQSTSDGTYTLTISFEPGTNLNLAQVLVQNRVNLALPELPEGVRAIGVTARKRSPEILLTVSLNSPDGTLDQLYISNYAVLNLKEILSRVDGISDVTVFGQRDYSMRIWVNPDQLEARNLTVLDVMKAVREQNVEVAFGQVGSAHEPETIPRQLTITAQGRLREPEDFEKIVVYRGSEGELVHLGDVAEVKFGALREDIQNRFDGKETVGLAIFLQPDANALDTADEVKKLMAELSKDFPPGLVYEIGYDTTPFIKASINEVFLSLRDAIILVAIVVLVFLQSWRSALIPLATVPIAIIGTFAAMAVFDFGINNLTLFGLVLAVGIVVDDAIVVVEAVQQQIEKGFSPREATLRAMEEVAGPVIAVGVVLSAVFVPCAFFPGIVGQFFRQFALTIAVSTLISTFNSLTLSPALAALLLPARDARPDILTRIINFCFGWFFRAFNWCFNAGGVSHGWIVSKMLRVPIIVLLAYGATLLGTFWWYQGAPLKPGLVKTPAFSNPLTGQTIPEYDFAQFAETIRLPTGFIPQADKGYLIASIQLPDAASAERTRAVIMKLTKIALETPGVAHVNAVAGNSFVLSSYGSNFGSMFIILDEFTQRLDPKKSADAVAMVIRKKAMEQIPEAMITIFGAPAVPGLGRAGGIKLMVQDRGDVGMKTLQEQTANLLEKGNQQPSLVGLFSSLRTASPQIRVEVNPAACAAEGVAPLDVSTTLSATLGARYVNDFNRFGRTWQVNVQASPKYRDRMEDIRRLKVRNTKGELVPIGTLANITTKTGPLVVSRYNMYPAAAIQGNVAPGASSGYAISVLEQLAESELRSSMGYEWTELTFIELRSRDTGIFVFLLSVFVVFLVLAALYESWALPMAVILVVPLCVLSSLVGVWFAQLEINIFTQVGFVVLIGLACKNAILIVEYARQLRLQGTERRKAVLAACRQRLRPILMTSVAFILGVVPLAFSSGAGSEMRGALGIAVFAGMIGVTFFGIFLTPVFYVVIDRIVEGRFGQSRFVRSTGRWLQFLFAFGWLRAAIRSMPIVLEKVKKLRTSKSG